MNDANAKSLISQYRRKGVLADTNILLLWFVGKFDPAWIEKFKRTQKFQREDFRILDSLLQQFDTIVTTPHILTEVNNLSGGLPEPLFEKYRDTFASEVKVFDEKYISSRTLCLTPHFKKFGLADAAIVEAVKEKYLVLTDDFPLANYLQKMKVDVLNFNNIRLLA
ncbi:MAG: hypothetical protein IAF08_04805 [Rhizobacter sp.]|nr:hypothetical protein [Chlorobiales bacterium]